MIRILILLQQK